MTRKPYQTVKVKGKTYDDYSITIKGIIYEASICRETKVLCINKDEWQGNLDTWGKKSYDNKSEKKPCAICRASFTIPPRAKTAGDRTLCGACKKAVKKISHIK